MTTDEKYIQRCLDLAKNGSGSVAPNPMVGAVIVYKNRILGEGFHRAFGQPHAEVNAINIISQSDRKYLPESTLYVNLEPCNHHGQTSPCTDLIIQSKIPSVAIASLDPNPLVSGKGVQRLRDESINVKTGILEKEANWLNRRFNIFYGRKRPYLILKWAQTADGYIGQEGKKVQISGDISNRLVHKWRSEEAGILIGTRTAEIDNPQLNTRLWKGSDPVRIILDRNLRLGKDLNIYNGKQPTLIITEKTDTPKKSGIKFGQINFGEPIIPGLMDCLYRENIISVLVEGGAQTLNSFLKAGIWDEGRIITSGKTIGNGILAPFIPGKPSESIQSGSDTIDFYLNRSE